MPIAEFPPTYLADEHGVLAWGGDLHPLSLIRAYSNGIFPWPHEGHPLLWFAPDPRAVLDFSDLHISDSLQKAKKKSTLTFTTDKAFREVITSCQRVVRKDQESTWITRDLHRAYIKLHEMGGAHSVEAWDTDGNLVGGLYGVTAGGYFAGESMFHRTSNASKFCVIYLLEHLKERGLDWVDIEIMTPHFALLGAKEIPRAEYETRILKEQQRGLVLF
jgi:leucyl/phenylalanyl-tRNA---protein transferase